MGDVIDINAARDRMSVRRQDRNPIVRALDALALALTEHGHTWTDEERSLYETGIMYALDMTNDGWFPFSSAPLGKRIILYWPAYYSESKLLKAGGVMIPADQTTAVLMVDQIYTRPEPTHWRFLPAPPNDAPQGDDPSTAASEKDSV